MSSDHQATAAQARVDQIEALSGIAALMVFFFHASKAYAASFIAAGAQPPFLPASLINDWIDLGRSGFVLFFLVSGFVILGSFTGADAQPMKSFARRRLFRVFPVFWVSLAATVLLAWALTPAHGAPETWSSSLAGDRDASYYWPLLPFAGAHVHGLAVLANATMLPSLFGQVFASPVYWMLEIELVFCAMLLGIYALSAFNGRTAILFAFALMGLAVLYAALGRRLGLTALHPLDDPSFQNLQYVSMMFAAAAVRFHWDARGDRAGLFASAPLAVKLYFGGLAAALLAVSAAQVFREGFGGGALRYGLTYLTPLALFLFGLRFMPVSRLGTFLGERSYSLFLFHMPAIIVINEILFHTLGPRGLAYPAYMILTCAGALLAAHIVQACIERPSIKAGQGDGRRGFALASVSAKDQANPN